MTCPTCRHTLMRHRSFCPRRSRSTLRRLSAALARFDRHPVSRGCPCATCRGYHYGWLRGYTSKALELLTEQQLREVIRRSEEGVTG